MNCFNDGFGGEQCSMSNGARTGIAVAVVVVGLLLIMVFTYYRRRRIQRANMVYVEQAQAQQSGPYSNTGAYYGPPPGAGYQPSYQQPYGAGYGEPQYPPKSYGNSEFAPPPGPPPADFEGPSSPPAYYSSNASANHYTPPAGKQ